MVACVIIISQVQQPHYSGTSGSAKTIPSKSKSGTQTIVTQLSTSNDMGCFWAWGWPIAMSLS